MWLANYYFSHDSLGFPVLLRICDAQSGRSFHPLHRYPGPLARTWRRPFHSCEVASPQAPTPDRESLPATIAESIRVGPNPCQLVGALGASNSPAPFYNCTESIAAKYRVRLVFAIQIFVNIVRGSICIETKRLGKGATRGLPSILRLLQKKLKKY